MFMNVDVEIYLKQIFHFFDVNPDQLKTLIGEMKKDKFYEKIKVKVYEHSVKGDELELTRQEMLDLIIELYIETQSIGVKVKKSPFMKTGFGLFGFRRGVFGFYGFFNSAGFSFAWCKFKTNLSIRTFGEVRRKRAAFL
jgi:hypothetical protein